MLTTIKLRPTLLGLFPVSPTPVAAGTSDPVTGQTRLALINQASQLPGPATHDRHQHLAVYQRDSLAVLVQIGRGMLPKCIGNAGHLLLSVGSRLPVVGWRLCEQLVDDLAMADCTVEMLIGVCDVANLQVTASPTIFWKRFPLKNGDSAGRLS